MGKYINRGNDGFKRYANGEYIDKTELIGYINSTISKPMMLTCVTRPRRFGKTAAAQMLYAYYDKSSDSRELFAPYKIAADPSFGQHLNKYPAIYLDVTDFTTRYEGRDDIVDIIQAAIIKDMKKVYPEVEVDDDADLMDTLLEINMATDEKFVMVIDEWDAICRENSPTPTPSRKGEGSIYIQDAKTRSGQTSNVTTPLPPAGGVGGGAFDKYVNFLRRMFKGGNTAKVFACVYMTGILPIKRYGTQSALNDFQEFSMANPRQLAGLFGFTEVEVKHLCEKYGMDYEDMKGWYDGYNFGAGLQSVFNPNSVIIACTSHVYDNYWGRTSAFETLQRYIDLDMNGVQERLEKLLRGERQEVKALRFGFDVSSIGSDDELLTLFIHLGYLSYNVEEETATVPNKEIRIEFVEALRGSKTHKKLSAMVKLSDRLMRATLDGDERLVAEIVGQIHDGDAGPDFYSNEQALRSVLKLGYISAIDKYISIQELPTGKGYADLVFIPRTGGYLPAVVVELKWNKTEHAAIDQIKERNYPDVLKRFTDNILLVGISYNEKTKEHTCRIEKNFV